jgi:thiosulfate/3-mercaptopyruvate sulfurtransferase
MSSIAGRRVPRARPTAGFPRPELIASTDWLADQLGRPDVRILDVRWRPDGSGRATWAAGHLPGAVHVDWRADLTDQTETGDVLLLAGPEQVARTLALAGVGDGATVVVYDDTVGLFAARTWWSLRVYGLESVRLLDGGYPAWADEGRPTSSAVAPPPPAHFTPRAQSRMRLTTPDVRALLSSPDVMLLDARAPAEYRGHEGNT